MKNKIFLKNLGNIFGIISLSIALIILFLILNWFLKINPYGNLRWLPWVATFFIIPIGFSVGFLSIKINFNKFARWGIIINGILFLVFFIRFIITTFIFLFRSIVVI